MTFPFSLPLTLKRPNSLFSTQTDLKSCSVAISDEWTAPAVKRRRSSRKFGLVKGDGCLKKFEGWRFEARIGGFSLDDNGSWDPGQILPLTPKLFQPFELYENSEIFLPTELEIYWVSDVMGGENGIDFDIGMPFEQEFVLQGSGGKEVGLSTFDSLIRIEEVEPKSSITPNTSSDNSKGKTEDDLERDHPRPA
ncbi:hypothetical protein V6N12_009646 [Hibiscus sabdariffa]|uniref:Uncharacterized protein n=1 Tax=Hibiscus sabdariffa TaxID=183260 RepID=A0ABR2BV19_9ROSI